MKGRRVKYVDTGEYGNSLEGYKGFDGKYYSSQAAYNHIIEVRQQKRQCIDKIGEIMDIGANEFVPPVMVKTIGKYSKIGFDVLYEVLCEQEKSIRWALDNKSFANDYQASKYIDAILGNNYREVKKRMDAQKRTQRVDKTPEVEQTEVQFNRVNKNKDISFLIGDNSWI